MKIIKLELFIEMICMYQIALSDNGIVKLISWVVFLVLFMAIFARLEKRYGMDN